IESGAEMPCLQNAKRSDRFFHEDLTPHLKCRFITSEVIIILLNSFFYALKPATGNLEKAGLRALMLTGFLQQFSGEAGLKCQ
ncbi:MAG TPA: hypothetical protein VEF34_10755, partial [Syntrophobacteraceae bacterium]|nr:hypothetical protein [Syntrophobacteraceae bacterium]